jgi:hypothetical protein
LALRHFWRCCFSGLFGSLSRWVSR